MVILLRVANIIFENMEEIEVKPNEDQSSKSKEDLISNESSLDFITKDKKVSILPVLNDKYNEETTKFYFKKLPKSDKEEEKPSTKIVYPANFYSSLSCCFIKEELLLSLKSLELSSIILFFFSSFFKEVFS